MPLIDNGPVAEFTPLPDNPNYSEPPPPPSFTDVIAAAGRTENDVVAAIDLMSQPKQKVDLHFNLVEEAKKRNVEPADFTDALNASHLDLLIKKRDQEIKDNSTLDQAGWLGFGARMAAGIVSPTTLIPMVGAEGTGVKVALAVAANAALGAGIQEATLFADQRTRTKTQALYSIGASAILGSVLGAVSHTVSKSVVDKIAHDMGRLHDNVAISPPIPSVGDAGAKEALHLQDVGKLKRGWGAHLLSPLSPITRNFEQWNAPAYIKEMGGSQQLRKMTAGFSQSSLALEKNVDFLAASPGGNVEDLKRTYAAVSYDGTKTLEKHYIEYILGTNPGGWFKKQRAFLEGAKRPDGKLTFGEFKRQITLDMWSNFSREGVPDMVRKAAKEIDEKVYKKLYDEGVEVGIFTGKEKTIGDENYANRVYNNEVIMRRHNEFVKILADHYRESLNKDFNEKLLKLQDAMMKDKQLFQDANIPLDKARQLRDDLLNEQVDVMDATNPQVIKGVEALRANNKIIKDLTIEQDGLKKIKLQGNDLEGFKARQDRLAEIEAALKQKALENEGVRKSLGQELEKYQSAAKEVRRRLNNLNQNVHLQDAKMNKKLDKIANNEDAQVTTILRAQKQLQKFVKMLDSVSDDKLDAELKKLKDSFHKSAEQYDKADQKLRDIMNNGPEVPGQNDVPPSPPKPPEGETPPDTNPPPPEVSPSAPPDTLAPPPKDTPPVEAPPKDPIGTYGIPKSEEEDIRHMAEFNVREAFAVHDVYPSVHEALMSYRTDMLESLKQKYPKRVDILDTAYKIWDEEKAKLQPAHDEMIAKKKAEHEWKMPRTELYNMSIRELEAAGLTKEEIAKIIKDPKANGAVLDKLHKGYKLYPDGTFAQFTEGEFLTAQGKWIDEQNSVQPQLMRDIEAAFKDDPNTPQGNILPFHPEPVTMDEAYKLLNEQYDKVKTEYEQAGLLWNRAQNRKELYGTYPQLEKGYMDLQSLDLGSDPTEVQKNITKYRMNSDLAVASTYFRTTQHAADWLEKYGSTEQKLIIHRIRDHIQEASFHLVDPNGVDPRYKPHREFIKDLKTGRPFRGVYVRERGMYYDAAGKLNPSKIHAALLLNTLDNGVNPVTLTHELIHSALATRVDHGLKNPNTPLGKMVKELEDMRVFLKDRVKKDKLQGSKVDFYVDYSLTDVHEMAANGLTDPKVIKYWRSIQYKGKTVYSHFVDIFRKMLGIPPSEETAFTSMLDITDRMLKQKDPAMGQVVPYNVATTENPFKTLMIKGQATPEEIKLADLRQSTPSDGKPFFQNATDGTPPEMKISDKMDELAKKMDHFAGKIDEMTKFDREQFKAEVNDMMRELADTHAKINAKRTLRNEKLWKQVEHLGPEMRAKRMEALQLKMKERPQKFLSRWNTKNEGAMMMNDNWILTGVGDFQKYATERAIETVDKIKGTERRLAYSDIIKEKRGPELARVLNIPSEKIQDFLETDIEKMLAIYTRTVGSDLSIARVFGSPDAAEDFAKLTDEQNNALAKIETMTDKDGKPLDQATKEELQYKTNKFYEQGRKDLMVLMERAKGIRGIPKDAASWSARGAKMAMDINFMRMMGNVVVSSIADPARLVMKYGMTRTFRDAFIPMITDWKRIRMSQKEALLAGSGLDPVLHSRAYSMTDIFDDAHRGTPIEKATHWASTKMGLIAGFDHWTSIIKQITAGAANAKLLDSISTIMEGKVKGKELIKAQEFLARNNLDADLVERIWREVTNGEGGGKVNGIWLPNTDAWKDAGAQRAYRAALGGEIDSTIITPGFERPSWVDSSIPARLVAQFKSFGFTSTQKTLMAGLQEHDAAFFQGVISSLALGALSYYLYAVASGGKTYEEMMNAGPDKWADEAISRSGVTAVFDEVQRLASRVPLMQKYATFSGHSTTRRGGGSLTSEALGPSFDLLSRAFKIGTEIDAPTQSTLHTMRTLLPLQNVFYLRYLLDQVEKAAGSNLPKKRAKQ